jgi:hypothetical protein
MIDIPSWVPYPGKGNIALLQHHKSFEQLQQVLSRTPSTPAIQPSITSDGRTLQAHGMCIGHIVAICKEVVRLTDLGISAPFEAWNILLNQAGSIFSSSDGPSDLPRALFRVMATTRDHTTTDDIMDTKYPVFKRVARILSDSPNSSQLLWGSRGGQDVAQWTKLKHRLALNSYNAWLVVLDDGTLDLAPQDIAVGDELLVLFRAPMPIVLRPQGNPYRDLGSAFIDFVVQDQIDPSMEQYSEGDTKCCGRQIRSIDLI